MPITKSALKALRQSRRRTKINLNRRQQAKAVLKTAKNKLDSNSLVQAQKALDRMAKKHLIHKNKAARLKSKLAKLTNKINLKNPKKKKPPTPKN
ncbi:MAG: 30S ribosomal protein S20 [Candidatus Pacebacteria bacterium]|nr:30S ribosomal protein S20 [Candidatus Paceibacterota bacterium]